MALRRSSDRSPADGDPGLRLRIGSEARRIASQHQQLDTLFGEVFRALDRGGMHLAAEAFRRFADALEAHFEVEESIYFPALHGLRPELGDDLTRLVERHADMREDLVAIRMLLDAGDRESAGPRLEQLALEVSEHEGEEERLVKRSHNGGPAPGSGPLPTVC